MQNGSYTFIITDLNVSYLRISDCNGSLYEAIVCFVNADSGHHKLSILHHSTSSGGPVLGTHLHSFLLTRTQHHYHTTLSVIEYLHKVPRCSHHWALSNDEAVPPFVALMKIQA